MQSSEIRVSGLGEFAGMPGGVTGSPFSSLPATSKFKARSWASKSFLALKP